MSSAVVSTSAALGRPFLFDAESKPGVCPTSGAKKLAGTQDSRLAQIFQSTIKNQQSTILNVTPASCLTIRPTPEMASSGIPALDALTGGLPRGCLTELCGPASSGRTTVLLAALAAATHRGEFCALIDASDTLDPQSTAAAGVDLDHLLWVRCNENSPRKNSPQTHRGSGNDFEKELASAVPSKPVLDTALAAEGQRVQRISEDRHPGNPLASRNLNQSQHCLEQALRATDLLLESGGFGLIVLDLADLPIQAARRIPLTTWFRFRRAVEHKPTILLAIEQQPIAGSCSSLLLQLEAAKWRKNAAHGISRGSDLEHDEAPKGRKKIHDVEQSTIDCESFHPTHAHLLTGININAELIRSRLERKPACSIAFKTRTAWAG
jgi:hypothetical protein